MLMVPASADITQASVSQFAGPEVVVVAGETVTVATAVTE